MLEKNSSRILLSSLRFRGRDLNFSTTGLINLLFSLLKAALRVRTDLFETLSFSSSPEHESTANDGTKSVSKSGIVRLSGIRDLMDRGKHALLDVTPTAVDKLNYAQFYPVVIFAKADTKQVIKECRTGLPK